MSETTTTTTPPSPPAPAPEPQTFSREYVHELREEAKSARQKAQGHESARIEAEQKAKEAQDAADKRAKEAEEAAQKRADDAEQKANARVINAELRVAAAKAGMLDLDGLKLIDAAKVKLRDDGTVEGAEEAMAEFKKAKPHFFGAASTSSTATPPAATTKPPSAMDMSAEEWRAARDKIRRGGKV